MQSCLAHTSLGEQAHADQSAGAAPALPRLPSFKGGQRMSGKVNIINAEG
jgi:hypothetical protein